jgi:hypothetical protein
MYLVDLQPLQCSLCNPGNQLALNLTSCGPIIPNCEYLNDTNHNVCYSCKTGYLFTTNKSKC